MRKTSTLIIASLLLVSCTAGDSENLQGQLSLEDQNKIIDLNDTLPEFSAEYKLNEDVIVQALALENEELCTTIEDDAQKASCLSLVADSKTLQAAIEELDLSACEQISADNMSNRCEILVNAELEKANFQTNIDNMSEQMSEIVESGKLSSCVDLEDTNFVAVCELNIKLDLASKEKDPSYCEGLVGYTFDICSRSSSK